MPSSRCAMEVLRRRWDEMDEMFQLALVVAFAAGLLVTGQLFMDRQKSSTPAVAAVAREVKTQ
jgi:hypothetical protein